MNKRHSGRTIHAHHIGLLGDHLLNSGIVIYFPIPGIYYVHLSLVSKPAIKQYYNSCAWDKGLSGTDSVLTTGSRAPLPPPPHTHTSHSPHPAHPHPYRRPHHSHGVRSCLYMRSITRSFYQSARVQQPTGHPYKVGLTTGTRHTVLPRSIQAQGQGTPPCLANRPGRSTTPQCPSGVALLLHIKAGFRLHLFKFRTKSRHAWGLGGGGSSS